MPLFTKILAPTDYSSNAAEAVRLAARVAAEHGAELYVAHVVSNSALRFAVREGMLEGSDTDDTVGQKARDLANSKLSAEIARLEGVTPTAMTALFGDPSRDIVAYAEKHGIDLIVMGRRGETLADVMLGSVAERVIRHAPCPVLITRTRAV